MRVVIQRVKYALVTVDEQVIGKINKGLMLLIGVGKDDTKELVSRYLDKIVKMRIFEDENGKTNLSLADVKGEILAISQFTLYADCKKGNRPSFIMAGSPELGKELYDFFIEECKKQVEVVEAGEFGADMKVELLNDGPFTIVLDESTFA